MPRSQIIVNVTPALPRRGNDSDTGTAFHVYAGATGSMTPTRCRSAADATATAAPAEIVQWVSDCLEQGAPDVVILRADATNPATVTEVEWAAALVKLTEDFGSGQVCIPGVSTAAAYDALIDHAAANQQRCVLLDASTAAAASALVTTATGLAAADGAERATLVTAATLPAPASTTRTVPGSVIAAGLVGRGDSTIGHANNSPVFDQSRGAGYVTRAVGVPKLFNSSELDDLKDAGVSVIAPVLGTVQLTGWVSLSDDDRYRQLNWGRMTMELSSGLTAGAQRFLGRQIDGRGILYAEFEGLLRGYLTALWQKDALFGATAAAAFDVRVAEVNTPATAAAGQLNAAIEVSFTASAETIVLNVITNISEGISA